MTVARVDPHPEVIDLIAEIGNLKHHELAYLWGGLAGEHANEPANSPFWTLIRARLEMLKGKPKPPATAKP